MWDVKPVSLSLNFDDKLAHHVRSPSSQKLSVTAAHPEFATALILSQSLALRSSNQSPLVITQDMATAESFRTHVELLQELQNKDQRSQVFILPPHDISPYSGLYSHRRLVQSRLQWLYRASFPEAGDVFVAPLKAVAQKTLPAEFLIENSHQYKIGEELPTDFATLLNQLGYMSVPIVEDSGTFSLRGGIIDIFSPAHTNPVRIELFGDQIESLRSFDPETQRSLDSLSELTLIPAQEMLFSEERIMWCCQKLDQAESEEDLSHIKHQLRNQQYFDGIEFLLPCFYEKLSLPLDYFSTSPQHWWLDAVGTESSYTAEFAALQEEFSKTKTHLPKPSELYLLPEKMKPYLKGQRIEVENLEIHDEEAGQVINFPSQVILPSSANTYSARVESLLQKIKLWRESQQRVFLFGPSETQYKKLKTKFEDKNIDLKWAGLDQTHEWQEFVDDQDQNRQVIHYVPRALDLSYHATGERLVFIGSEHFLKKSEGRSHSVKSAISKAQALSFSELKEGDPVIHALHGVAIYLGLKVMNIGGAEAEFLELKFKDNDKLFLPIYRLNQVNKFSGAGKNPPLDKLGGKQWGKTKAKAQKRLREIADELVKLYAARKLSKRPVFNADTDEITEFVNAFPYQDTQDQAHAYTDLKEDLETPQPMDRLICGDVGFGKTEMAMRAAFIVASQKRQVAILAPTTILTFQHFESFKKRFKDWPLNIKVLNRFVPRTEIKKTLENLKAGQVDIVIGTHRLLSRDIEFKDLGLLVIDEEQKFGVKHKERIRKLKSNVDTLAMSATPIPRTLNMSLLGIRDLSLINTPPHDRLPTRTFVCKFDMGVIRKGVMAELKRGGQVFFLHNRVQSIYALAEELRANLPGVKLAVAHGQMDEKDLEKTIVAFFNKEIDMLVCTTIIESGMDIPNANTMFVDQAQALGLSQLYQLRGRVGRSKQRAFCYLLIPRQGQIEDVAKERLRILQQNTALGSGIQIAQYDLELRGAGTILGEEQSGTIDAIGYEMYMDLLEQAVHEAKGEPYDPGIEPEINLKVKALIPHSYMPDIRLRLSYYKALSSIQTESDLDQIEEDLRDQFGSPPEEVFNLMGLMMIRLVCKELGIRDVSAGTSTVSLSFTENTKLPAEKVVELSLMPNKKYAITPDNRLKIRMKNVTWQNIYEELQLLTKYID